MWEWVDSNHQSQKGTDLQSVRLPVTGYSSIGMSLFSGERIRLARFNRLSPGTVLYLKGAQIYTVFDRYGAQAAFYNLFSEVEEILKKTRLVAGEGVEPSSFGL